GYTWFRMGTVRASLRSRVDLALVELAVHRTDTTVLKPLGKCRFVFDVYNRFTGLGASKDGGV
ncbi:hypothetical protein BRC77_02365, partial [Halobacteriales archaeon QH_8_64_26]